MSRDAVTPELHAAVLVRDKRCVLSIQDAAHVCRDQWNREHSAFDLAALTLEHVHCQGGMMGKRAPSDMGHLVALCAAANLRPPTKEQRQWFREYLTKVRA